MAILCGLASQALAILFVAQARAEAPKIAASEPLSPAEQRSKFKLPPGFEIQLVVSEPTIGQPMNLNFDARGRLWVTSSLEYPFPVAEGKPGRDTLCVLAGIGADGKPAAVTRFATGLNIPIGNVPLRDGDEAVVYSIPSIWRCGDGDGDGVADSRELLYGTFGYVDTHGMSNSYRRWIDGWIYGCHGFKNSSLIHDRSGHTVAMTSGNTYRFREDGSVFEQRTWGQVNPFGQTFDIWGNLYDSDCHSMPIYMLLPGGQYPGFGRKHDGLGFAPKMITHAHGSTGICGPAYYGAEEFPPRIAAACSFATP